MTTPSSFRRATVVWFIALLATVHAGAAPLKVHGIFSSHKVNGHEWLPLQNFRTDSWDWPEGEDPTVEVVNRAAAKALQSDAEQRLAYRRAEEAKQAVRILSEIENLSKPR